MSDFTKLEQLQAHIHGCPTEKLDDYKATLILFPAFKEKALYIFHDIAFHHEGDYYDMPDWNDKLIDIICG